MNFRAALHVLRSTGVLLLAFAWSGPASAQAPPAAASTPPPDEYEVVVQELIDLFIKRGLLKREEADALIARVRAKLQAEAPSGAPEAPEAVPPGSVRVIHLTEVEKERIREQIRQEVLAKAQAEGWAQPGVVPDWIKRVEIGGDIRMRYELDAFDGRNVPAIDFQTLNSGLPYDYNQVTNRQQPPWLNNLEDRRRMLLRARLGVAAEVASGVHAELRLATGSTDNPVSRDVTLGSEFAGLSLVLDRAFIRYRPLDSFGINAGRFPNPFVSTELIWDSDLNFDGMAATYTLQDAFLTVGAFSVGNTPFNMPSLREDKYGSRDKWLYGAQLGATFGLPDGGTATLASAYYYYHQIEGELSSPCDASTAEDPCDTDHSRPGFVQKGNTMFGIRDTESFAGNTSQFEYFGLAAPFHELSATMRFDFLLGGPHHAVVDAEGVVNLVYDEEAARDRIPANNYTPLTGCDSQGQNCTGGGQYDGGFIGYLVQLTVGHLELGAKGAWNAATSFRYLETDAVVDAFTDSDFHLGGTNAKGFTLGGSFGIADGSWLSLRWLSATEITAEAFANDVYQVDLNARF